MAADKKTEFIKPLMPKGFRTGVFPDENPPVGSLTIETEDRDYTFAINAESCDVLKEVVAHLEKIVKPQ